LASYTTTIDCDLGIDEVWSRISDVTRFVEWDPGVLKAVQVSGSGPGPDASYVLTVKGVRGPLDLRYDVNQFSPPKRLFLVADTGALRSEDEISITPLGSGSRLEYRADLQLSGWYALASPLLALAFQIIGRRAAAGLRRFLLVE
jgi:carbon monoxide dehydrogenase subunit G